MNALAPSVSHALNLLGPESTRADICRTDDAFRATPDSKPMLMADCAYCLPHAGTDALMPNAITGLAILGGHALRPFLFYRAPKPLLMLISAPPRGPPPAL